MITFKVMGIEMKAEDEWKVTLRAQTHPIYSSTIYLTFATESEVAPYQIGRECLLGCPISAKRGLSVAELKPISVLTEQ